MNTTHPSSVATTAALLPEPDRERIRAEEIFREEVRAALQNATPHTWRGRIWKFLNSSFAIFLLSSVFLGAISWQYQRWVSNQTRESELALLREEASLELRYRFFIMREMLKQSTATGRDGLYVRAVFFGQQPYAPAASRFKEVSVPAVMFVLQREKVADPLEKIITKVMPEMSVAVQRLAAFEENEPLDSKTREEILEAVAKIKVLALQW